MLKRALCFAAVIGLAGCGGCDDGPLQAAPGQIAQAVCPRAWECCTAELLADNDYAAMDVASCEEETEDGFQGRIDFAEESIEKGRSAYNPARLEACLDYLRTASCGQLNRTNHFSGVPGCATFVDPLTPPGSACSFNGECIDGFCEIAEGSEEGTCRALPKENEACTEQCARDLICHGDRKVCVDLADPGERCEQAIDCITFSCSTTSSTSTTTKVCDLPPDGTQCFYASACSAFGSRPADIFALALVLAWIWILRRTR